MEDNPEIKKQNIDKIVVYVPQDARLNLEVNSQNPPTPKYNSRMQNIDQDVVKKIVGGKYGREDIS